MKEQSINQLLDVLKPALKDRRKAKELLQTKILVIIWTVEQVYRAANERGLALTPAEALQVLGHLRFNYNAQYGIKWSDITDYIEDKVLGRKLSKRELNRFVHKDIIIVQKS